MLKKISENKSQLIMLMLVMATVIGRGVITQLNRGNPGVVGGILCVAMCVLFVLFFFINFPANKEEFFTGRNIVRIVSILLIFLWAHSESYVDFDYVLAMVVLPVMIFCASDIRLMPVNVAVALGMAAGFETVGFVSVPCAVIVSLVLVAPHLNKDSKAWEKIVFAAVQLCLIIDYIYIIYQMRFMFTFTSVIANRILSILLILFAVFFIACAVLSLKKPKASKSGKKSKKKADYAISPKKSEYFSVTGYVFGAAVMLVFTTLDIRYSMSGLVGVLMTVFTVCKNGTCVEKLTDKAADAIGGFADKIFGEKAEE